jgi:DNA-binding GntR family transcriptional regulator
MVSLYKSLENDTQNSRRMTTSEEVFLQLKADIVSLKLGPGSKISEAEIAKARDVSRQPVREAFLRLAELNLLKITPQKATRIRKISHNDLRNTRFLRVAVEVEVVRAACQVATLDTLAPLAENLTAQQSAVKERDTVSLQGLDFHFHRLICFAADRLPAFQTIAENKIHTDRVCTLELSNTSGMEEVLEGHTAIYDAIKMRDEEVAVAATRHHLRHLDETLSRACERHPELFDD